VEAAGIEEQSDSDATENGLCTCENCRECRAASALHEECFKSRYLASLDNNLQRVIETRYRLDGPLRGAVMAIVGGSK
jgi:hypothetical protein